MWFCRKKHRVIVDILRPLILRFWSGLADLGFSLPKMPLRVFRVPSKRTKAPRSLSHVRQRDAGKSVNRNNSVSVYRCFDFSRWQVELHCDCQRRLMNKRIKPFVGVAIRSPQGVRASLDIPIHFYCPWKPNGGSRSIVRSENLRSERTGPETPNEWSQNIDHSPQAKSRFRKSL